MKKLVYILIITIVVSGCNRATMPKSGSIYGSWYTTTTKWLNSNKVVYITQKEQFYRDGTLISSKWFNFRDRRGVNLGEFYITKQFKFNKNSQYIKASFIGCSTGITKKLKAPNLGYKELSKVCKTQIGIHRVTKKGYRVLKGQLLLGKKRYLRDLSTH